MGEGLAVALCSGELQLVPATASITSLALSMPIPKALRTRMVCLTPSSGKKQRLWMAAAPVSVLVH